MTDAEMNVTGKSETKLNAIHKAVAPTERPTLIRVVSVTVIDTKLRNLKYNVASEYLVR